MDSGRAMYECDRSVIIRRKFKVPPLAAETTTRPRLERLVAELVESHPVVVISATAGAGKTTAVARAVELLDRPVAWLTVDRTDAAPGRLVAYLEAALACRIPGVAGVARAAAAAGVSHPEAAGLLAEAAGEEPVVLVLDDLERLGERLEAWAVVDALLRYAPAAMRIVLVSRRELPPAVAALPPGTASAAIGESDLAFTVPEAADALAAIGRHDVDPGAAVEATGGWVTGVLFEAWRSDAHAAAMGGEADPLYGYLAAHIAAQLPEAAMDFLVRTSLLEEVTAARAEALRLGAAAERLAAVRRARLPASWHAGGRAMRCHPRFREYLLERLSRLPAQELRELRLAHGRMLAAEGLHEEATEALLLAGARTDALASAEHAIVAVIERLDLGVASRWLDALGAVEHEDASPLTTAELMLAVAREDYRRGLEIADRLDAAGRRDGVARSSPRLAALMAWCYLHAGRLDDVRQLLAVAPDDPMIDAVRYAMRPLTDLPHAGPPSIPSATGGAVDALLMRACYHLGRLTELAGQPTSRWVEAVIGPWRIGALRATGRIQRALEVYDTAQAAGVAAVGLHALVGPELLIDAGRAAEARAALERGRHVARRSGSLIFELFNGIVAAKLELRLVRDPPAARRVLDRLEQELGARDFPHVREMLDTWYGFALLLEGDDAAALARLRAAVAGMLRGDRLLELPTAAVYLAEAEWRAGEEERADRAADLALEAARRQGSNHTLLTALADFAAVVSRRIDAEPAPGSAWHELGRALLAQGVTLDVRIAPAVVLQEFGAPAMTVDGQAARPRIAKSYELLAFLAQRNPAAAERDELLEALFGGRADSSARSYLRQAVHQLRQVLPGPDAVVSADGRVRLASGLQVLSTSQLLERDLAEAARMRGQERLQATLEALKPADRGEYFAGVDSDWIEQRRRRLADLLATARYEAAELAFSAGHLDDAQRLAERVLRAEPYRESAWRLTMRIADALGDDDGVIVAYRHCEQALRPLGIEPSPGTRRLLERLRR